MLNAVEPDMSPVAVSSPRWESTWPWLGSFAVHGLALLALGLGLGMHLVTELPLPAPIEIVLQTPKTPTPPPFVKPPAPPAARTPIAPAAPVQKTAPAPAALQASATATLTPVTEFVAPAAPSPAAVTVPAPVAAPAPAAQTAVAALTPAPKPALVTTPAAAPAALIHASHNAAYLQNPPPRYPDMSRRMGESGTVTLWVAVSPAGTVNDLGVLKPSGYARLDEAAKLAVRQWRFVPAKRGGEAVADTVSVPIEFGL